MRVQPQYPGIGAGQQQQARHQLVKPVDLLESAHEHPLVLRGCSHGTQGDLHLSFEDGQRRLQFMGCIGAELAHLVDDGLQAVKHIVERGCQTIQFIAAAADLQALVQVVAANSLSGLRHLIDGLQRPSGKGPSAPACKQQTHGQHRRHRQEKAPARFQHVLHGQPHANQIDHAAAFDHGQGQQPQGIGSGSGNRFVGGSSLGRILEGF